MRQTCAWRLCLNLVSFLCQKHKFSLYDTHFTKEMKIMNARKVFSFLTILVVIAAILVACASPTPIIQTVTVKEVVTEVVEVAGTPQVVEKVVEVVVTPTSGPTQPPAEKASPFDRADVVRFGILADLDGLNPWYLYDTTGSSYWNYVIATGYYPSLYTTSDQRWDWVPLLA